VDVSRVTNKIMRKNRI